MTDLLPILTANATAWFNGLTANGLVDGPQTLITGILAPFAFLGFWFYFIFYMLAIFLIFMKTQDFVTTAIVVMVTAGALAAFMPSVYFNWVVIVIVAAITTVIYVWMKG